VNASRLLGVGAALVAAFLLASAAALGSPAAASATHVNGTLADGATWIADVPAGWNGTVLLFSHGFGPPVAQEPLGGPAHDALLARGYALAASSYDPHGSWWALQSAVRDQFQTIDAATSTALPHAPDRVLAVGTSMGGLVSALEAEQGAGHIDGALTTCGIVAGGVQLNNYQLDAEYVISKLLAPAPLQLVNFFPDLGAGFATGLTLAGVAQQAQTTPEGRARLSLALAFLNATPYKVSGSPTTDPTAFETAQFTNSVLAFPTWIFINAARPWIEMSAGGNASWTLGENFASLLDHTPNANVVRALYREAGLDLRTDLATLTAGANIPADPTAIDSLRQTSVPTGHLQVPELDLHTIGDPLVPVEMENQYASVVRAAGSNSLLRQAYVDRFGHCSFNAAELTAGVEALRSRVETGHWGSVAEAQKLTELASSLGLGDSAFVEYQPLALSGDNGPFDPSRNALSSP
jgi:hypothetical protein